MKYLYLTMVNPIPPGFFPWKITIFFRSKVLTESHDLGANGPTTPNGLVFFRTLISSPAEPLTVEAMWSVQPE
jgi:hypothetical protein